MARSKSSGRLNLRLPPALKKWAKDFARQNHTTVTQIVVDYFTRLQQESQGVEQI